MLTGVSLPDPEPFERDPFKPDTGLGRGFAPHNLYGPKLTMAYRQQAPAFTYCQKLWRRGLTGVRVYAHEWAYDPAKPEKNGTRGYFVATPDMAISFARAAVKQGLQPRILEMACDLDGPLLSPVMDLEFNRSGDTDGPLGRFAEEQHPASAELDAHARSFIVAFAERALEILLGVDKNTATYHWTTSTTETRFSNHLRIGGVALTAEEWRLFGNLAFLALEHDVRFLPDAEALLRVSKPKHNPKSDKYAIDFGIYTRNRLFRMILCSKGKPRALPKLPDGARITDDVACEQYMMSHVLDSALRGPVGGGTWLDRLTVYQESLGDAGKGVKKQSAGRPCGASLPSVSSGRVVSLSELATLGVSPEDAIETMQRLERCPMLAALPRAVRTDEDTISMHVPCSTFICPWIDDNVQPPLDVWTNAEALREWIVRNSWRTHKSNNAVITVKNGHVRIWCHDCQVSGMSIDANGLICSVSQFTQFSHHWEARLKTAGVVDAVCDVKNEKSDSLPMPAAPATGVDDSDSDASAVLLGKQILAGRKRRMRKQLRAKKRSVLRTPPSSPEKRKKAATPVAQRGGARRKQKTGGKRSSYIDDAAELSGSASEDESDGSDVSGILISDSDAMSESGSESESESERETTKAPAVKPPAPQTQEEEALEEAKAHKSDRNSLVLTSCPFLQGIDHLLFALLFISQQKIPVPSDAIPISIFFHTVERLPVDGITQFKKKDETVEGLRFLAGTVFTAHGEMDATAMRDLARHVRNACLRQHEDADPDLQAIARQYRKIRHSLGRPKTPEIGIDLCNQSDIAFVRVESSAPEPKAVVKSALSFFAKHKKK